MSWGSAIGALVTGGIALYGANKAAGQADKAFSAQNNATARQLDLLEQFMGRSNALDTWRFLQNNSTADDLDSIYAAFLQQNGMAPVYGARDIHGLTSTYYNDIQNERARNWGRVEAEQAGLGSANMPDQYAQLARELFPTDPVAYTEGGYDRLVTDLAEGYLSRFAGNTEREIGKLYAQAQAAAEERGLGESTFAADLMSRAAAQSAELRDADVVKAMDAAFATAGQRMNLDTGGLSNRLSASGHNFDQRIRSVGEAANLSAAGSREYWNNRSGAIDATRAYLGMNPNDLYTAGTFGTNTVINNTNAIYGSRGRGIDERTALLQNPLNMRTNGADSMFRSGYYAANGYGNAAAGYSDSASAYSRMAGGNMIAAGDAFDRFLRAAGL